MFPMPVVLPISDLCHAQAQILDRLGDDPILLTRQDKAVAVWVDPTQWNQLLEQLEDLQDALDGLAALAEYRKDPSQAIPLSEVLYEFGISEHVLAEEAESYE
ncbi:MAG: type II toxin-antitoxin system Phd/YefM family antitoxin [Caldilineaceae bacterium]|nr:type II toxin-antitoxin system Phd/YefM family antitoxin [Caldilineaceae bacterium]MBP8108169.1 type II toxin-antitoxin system Phd/YefM family antitoxin [Caldilineaceae bacterium]MBP8123277.1 type II toxin-antitoxin system Phd/YefM family antitoxin [Caldilineaceae bacterium]MBP9072881.1 type II toxin-antitoxin system Phd/YefM family antitoxin [Caldilineaceae bacterium]